MQECAACVGPQYSPYGAAFCRNCGAGTYRKDINSPACTLCPNGTFSEAIGATDVTACSPCPASYPVNTTTLPGAMNSSMCFCPPGYKGPGRGPCTPCPATTFKSDVGPQDCTPCEEGSYNAEEAAWKCTPCPLFSTSPIGSVESNCTCVSGYRDIANAIPISCQPCIPGTFGDDCLV